MPRKKTRFTCSKCGKTFGMAMHLGRHMATIHGKSPAKSARGPKPPKGAARTARPAGRPAGAAGRFGLRNMSLEQLIDVIAAAREEANGRIAEIQAAILPLAPRAPGRAPGRPAAPKAAPARGRRLRRTFKVSGPESILAFVRKAGKRGATTAEIVKRWKAEKRSGDGYTTLGELVKARKLTRESLKGQKGSRYTSA